MEAHAPTGRPAGELESGFLDERDVLEAARLLARAFAEDPIITHYLAGPRRRRLPFPVLFRSVLHELEA